MVQKEITIFVDEEGRLRVKWDNNVNPIDAISMCQIAIRTIEKDLVDNGKIIKPRMNVQMGRNVVS